MPITADVLIPGGVRAAPLGLAFEQGVARYVFDKALAVPAQISLHIRDRAEGVQGIRSVTRLVRAGRTMIVTDGEIRDAADDQRLIAYGSIIWAVIGDAPGAAPSSPEPDHHGTGVDVTEAAGIEALEDGTGVSLAGLTPQTLGPGGILHAGMFQLLCEQAALTVGRSAMGADRVVAVDCTYDFLQPGKVGPFVARANIIHTSSGGADIQVRVHDEGNANRLGCVSWVRVVQV